MINTHDRIPPYGRPFLLGDFFWDAKKHVGFSHLVGDKPEFAPQKALTNGVFPFGFPYISAASNIKHQGPTSQAGAHGPSASSAHSLAWPSRSRRPGPARALAAELSVGSWKPSFGGGVSTWGNGNQLLFFAGFP